MTSHRILLGGLFHETNTFVDSKTHLLDFEIRRDQELLDCIHDSSPLGGFLAAAKSYGWEVRPTVDYRAMPSGLVADEVIESFKKDFFPRAQKILQQGVDAIFLILHGAMVSESCVDVEGELLEQIRKLPGCEKLPLFGVVDLHANFTQKMAGFSNGLLAYHENPHIDARESAQRAANLLHRSLTTGEAPKTYWYHPPIMWPPSATSTGEEPMFSLEALARRLEKQHAHWAINVWAGFSHADTPDSGVSFSVITTRPASEAREVLARMGQQANALRDKGLHPQLNLDDVICRLIPEANKPILLVEPADNIGGGAPGDGTAILRALVRHKVPHSGVIINDPESVEALRDVLPGNTVSLRVGGKGSKLDEGPVEMRALLLRKTDGQFELEDKQSHLASISGSQVKMGPCAIIQYQGVTILLTSKKTPPFDLGQWRSQGIEPKKFSVIGIKAAVAHRHAYDPIAGTSFFVDTPGPCTSHLSRLAYQKLRRPIFPLDPLPVQN